MAGQNSLSRESLVLQSWRDSLGVTLLAQGKDATLTSLAAQQALVCHTSANWEARTA